jgi:hypothetical protein
MNYRFLARIQDFSLLHSVHKPVPETHAASYPMITADASLGVQRLEHKADHSPSTNTKVKNMWIYTFTPPYVFMALCLIRGLYFYSTYCRGQYV